MSSKKGILGIDVSHYEPAVDWSKAKQGGVLWMYTKASEGAGHVDLMLHKHADSARAAGVINGAYHFFHAGIDGELQANLYLKAVAGMKLDLPHILDWEAGSADGVHPVLQAHRAKAWLDAVEHASGRVPWIYGGESFLKELKLGPEFAKYPLIIAHYGCAQDHVKTPQPWAKYAAWQYTDSESVPGLAQGHHVDANVFNGSLDELRAYVKS